MIIHCPYCGFRYSEEFSYEGDATISRPNKNNSENKQAWYDYVYSRINDVEFHQELWWHVRGCEKFMVVRRNLRTHQISHVQTMAEFKEKA